MTLQLAEIENMVHKDTKETQTFPWWITSQIFLNTLDLCAAYEGIYRQDLWAASHI